MTVNRTTNVRQTRIANPLATVAIFLTFCEITSGFAATQTDGWTRGAFTVFSVSFPVIVALGLFILLWKKPEVLYAPGDYSAETPISDYVDAVRGTSIARNAETQNAALKSIVTSAVEATIRTYSTSDSAVAPEEAREAAEMLAVAEIKKNTIHVTMPIVDAFELAQIAVPADSDTTLAAFLDRVYFALQGIVPPFTYGDRWILIDSHGTVLGDIGTRYARTRLDSRRDDRPLSTVGLTPGDTIRVKLLTGPDSASGR